jgi:hypothetical protein
MSGAFKAGFTPDPAVGALVAAMQGHPDNADVQLSAYGAVSKIATICLANQVRAG